MYKGRIIFKEWKIWQAGIPWTLRWFIWLVLFRPIIDNLYFLKNISPLLSPGYWAGLLTPLLCLNAIISIKRQNTSLLDRYFKIWGLTVTFGTLLIFLFDPFTLLSVEFLIKLLLPVYLYPMLRRLIRSEEDLHQLIYTFLLSFIPVSLILLFEISINPIRVEESRGMARIQGNFGDVVSYGLYMAFGFASVAYLFFKNGKRSLKAYLPLVLVLLICLLGLFNIHHVASYAVFFGIFGLFVIFLIGHRQESGLIAVTVVMTTIIYFSGDLLQERLTPIVAKDIAVYQGDLESSQLFHGRMGRWQHMWKIFSSKNMVSQFLGYPVNFEYAYHFVGMGAHNDFIRLLFLSGYIGLASYLTYLFQVFIRIKKEHANIRFLAYASVLGITLYSISVTPTFYAPFMYFVITIFAFIAMSSAKRKSHA